MALIGKIRQNMWFVFALLGVALVAFMMMDSSPGGGGGNATAAALSVNGEKIDIQQLQRLEEIESNATGFSGNSLRSKVYDDFITRSLVNEEGEDLGIGVSDDELQELLYGRKLSPIIQQMPMFLDQRTRTINQQVLQDVKTNIEGANVNPGFKRLWDEKTKQVVSAEVQNKIANLVTKGIYTPTWMAEELSKTNGITADVDYVKVPFSASESMSVELTDSDYTAFMNENKAQFENKESGRVVEYVVFDIEATAQDSANLKNEVAGKIEGFLNASETNTDSVFALSNGGNFINFYFKKEDLPETFQSFIDDVEVGEVHGPVLNDRYYSAIKLLGKKVVADSVKLSHVFRPIDATTPNYTSVVDDAVDYMDSLKNIIESGAQSFDSIAIKYSLDPSTASAGGDLGYVTQGQFFPSINEKAFFTGNIGELYTVKTQNGVHLIKITERIFTNEDPKYKVAFINQTIEPSEATTGDITNKASEFISDNRSIENLRANLANFPGARLKTSKILTKKDYSFEEYGFSDDARNIVLWAFNDDSELGDVSPDMFSFRDEQFNYEKALVIPAIQAVTKKGMAKLSDVKGSITDQVMEFAKARKLADMMKGKSIEEIAALEGATTGSNISVRTSNAFIPEIGYEPKVIATVISTANGATSAPIIGTAGAFVVKVNTKTVPAAGNGSFGRQLENQKSRQNVSYQLFEAMRKEAKVKDKRMDFGM